MRKIGFVAAAALAWTIFVPQPAEAGAPSFNCRNARLPSEIAICQSSELGSLDVTMSNQYYSMMNDRAVPYHVRQTIKREQINWLHARNTCGYGFACLQSSYWNRIDRLAWWYAQYH
jgi:uncharacterized protein